MNGERGSSKRSRSATARCSASRPQRCDGPGNDDDGTSGDHADHLDGRQGVDARQARAVREGCRSPGRAGHLLPGALLRAVLRHHAGQEVLPVRRAGRRTDRAALRRAREGARDGHGPPDLRGAAHRRVLQHGGPRRLRRHDPRQVPQEPHPARREVLGEVLLPSGQHRLPGLRHRGRQGRHVHLLRPALPRRMARARSERRAHGLQPQRHQAGSLEPAVGDRGPCGSRRERLLRARAQPGRASRTTSTATRP